MTEVTVVRKRSINIRDARIAGLYDLEHTIGKGHFAVVKLARHVFTGEKVACKIIDKTNLDPVSKEHIMQEVRCMKLVQHPNIVRLYEVIDTQTKLFLCLELGDYDMHDFILKHEKGVAEPLAQQYFCQIITAIDYCHKLHVVHRDLKPENVVFFEKLGMVKLTDFGFSNLYEPGQQLQTSCGSLAYSAPEILLGDSYDAPAVDVWSLGVILYMLVYGRLPFQETNDSETLTKILDCKYALPESLSIACRNLIQRMLVRDPSKRATLTEIVANQWVSAGDRGHANELPLIMLHHLPHSAHTTIVEQMVAGKVGSEEAILRALENDEYSSLTATYYLLAERVLATYREEKAKELMSQEPAGIPDEELIEGADRSRAATGGGSRCRSRSNSWRARPCSILKEESEEELSTYLRSASRQSSRNSSPSVSMFSGSARDRVSPQAVQDLLEFSRLGSRRAASPDSIRSSRSPSPPASSSGRTSPAVSSLSFARLKVTTPTTSSGMRKLSSSPHLLGICEEGEEGGEVASSASLLSNPSDGMARTNRSASTGLVHVIRHPVQATKSTGSSHTHLPQTYRRYEQHQRFVARSRRSASCSSSEASDDEESKRLSLISSKYCNRRKDGGNDKDDEDKGNGGVSGTNGHQPSSVTGNHTTSSNTSKPSASQDSKPADNRGGPSDSCISALMPIPEMHQLDTEPGEGIRARLMHRSHTAERILRDWAGTSPPHDNWLGTPPRELPQRKTERWIRKLQRARSTGDLEEACEVESVAEEVQSSFDDILFDLSVSSSEAPADRASDSGCSSEIPTNRSFEKPMEKQKTVFNIDLLFDQPRREKVDIWLRSSQFAC